jgi:hypothetical protein
MQPPATVRVPATPSVRPTPTGPVEPAAASAWYGRSDCRDVVQIRNSRPTIDFEADVVTVSGELVVGGGGPVKDLAVCIGGSCKPIATGKVLAEGETVPFFVAASRHRPTGLTVRCSVLRGR